jgi:hypothetical protein
MTKLRIKYIDNFIYQDIPLYDILRKIYDIEIVEENPDVVVSGDYLRSHLKYDCFKIFFGTENMSSNYKYADISLGSNQIHGYPNTKHCSCIFHDPCFDSMINKKSYDEFKELKNSLKTKFCAFMYSNQRAKARKVFCIKLMDYKKVDCLGKIMRNTEIIKVRKDDEFFTSNWRGQAMNIYKDYKFVIAFENSSSLGYLTEKILLPLSVGSIPIYWGAPDVKDYINPECFINVNDFDSFEDCIEYVKKVDNDDELYQKYINAKPILPNSKLYQMSNDEIGKFLKSRLDILLENPNIRVGKIGILGRIRYRLWFNWSMALRRERQLLLYNVKMPIWEKIKWVIKKA